MDKRNVQWPKGRRAAISLTYDDGLANHLQVVAPQLESRGLRATFYVPLKEGILTTSLDWRKLAARGHELGNHTVFHPCWSPDGRHANWLPEAYNLANYTEEHWLDEVRTANQALKLIDGRAERTFGNTCFDNYMGPKDAPICLEPLIEQVFPAARGENTGKPVELGMLNFNNLGTIWADRRDFGDFTAELQGLLDSGGWIIYTFHSIGRESYSHWIDEGEHRHLLDFLQQNSDQIWTAPVIDVVQHLKRVTN